MHFQSSKVFFIKWASEQRSGGDERGMHIYVSSGKLQVRGDLDGEEEQHFYLLYWARITRSKLLKLCQQIESDP